MPHHQFELMIIAISATLGIYVGGARMTLILEAAKQKTLPNDAVGKIAGSLKGAIWSFNLAVYLIFVVGLLASLSALDIVKVESCVYLSIMVLEFFYLLVLHIIYDLQHLKK